MNFILQCILTSTAVITIENVLLTRALGLESMFLLARHPSKMKRFFPLFVGVTTVLSMMAWRLSQWLSDYPELYKYRPLFLLLCISAFYVGIHLLFIGVPLLKEWSDMLVTVFFNCAVLGMLLLPDSGYSFSQYLTFGFGTGIGYLIAALLIVESRHRLAMCDSPRTFRGLPVSLLYIGFISLGIYGFIGHQLPF